MYICDKCGKLFDDDELPQITEHFPLCEEFDFSTKIFYEENCSCGGEIVKALSCEKCGEYFKENGRCICEKCLNEYKSLDIALEIGSDWEEKLSLNGFLASSFTKEEIELILIDTLKNNEKEKMENAINDFCEYDIDNFWGYAEKKWKEEK